MSSLCLAIIDDDLDDRNFFEEACAELYGNEANVISVNGDNTLRDLLITCRPDVIFLDLYMPKIDGESLLIQLKSNYNICNIPVLVFSSSFSEEQKSLLLELGAEDFVEKPNSFKGLKKLITDSVEKYSDGNVMENFSRHYKAS